MGYTIVAHFDKLCSEYCIIYQFDSGTCMGSHRIITFVLSQCVGGSKGFSVSYGIVIPSRYLSYHPAITNSPSDI